MSRTEAAADRSPRTTDMNRRIFKRLMPLLILCYLMSFLDRTNISLAKERLEADLGISAAAYGLGAGLFFLAYAVSEIPSNLIMHKVGARRWIFRIMITWGLLSVGMTWVQGETSFYVMRLLLGMSEAGLFPGIMLYLTYWFGAEFRARAIGLFLVGVCLSTIVGAPLGGALMGLDGVAGLYGWQWMFLVEGLPTVLLAFVVLKFLPDRPSQASWLTAEEAARLEADLAEEQGAATAASGTHSLGAVFKDRQMLMCIAVYWCHQVAVYSVVYFLPGIIGRSGGLSPLQVGLLTTVPWIAAAVGAVFGPRRLTGARRSRTAVTIGLLAMSGGLFIGSMAGPVLGLAGFCLAAFFFFVVQPPLFVLPGLRLSGATLAGGLALLNTVGATGGFIGPYAMGFTENLTGDPLSGLWLGMGLLVVGAAVSCFLDFSPGERNWAAAKEGQEGAGSTERIEPPVGTPSAPADRLVEEPDR
jgi:MFS family permease